MLKELDIGKKDIASDLLGKAQRPDLTDDIQKRLDVLRKDNFVNNNNNNNNNFSLPPSHPTFNNFIPPTLPPPPPTTTTFNSFNLPPPSLSPPPTFNGNFNLPSPLKFSNVFSQSPKRVSTIQLQHPLEVTLTKTKAKPEKVIEIIDTAIYKIPDPFKIEIGDPLLNVLSTDAEDISKDDSVTDKVVEDKTIEQIKDEYNFDDIKDTFDDGKIPPQLEFFLVVKMKTLSMPVTFYHLTKTIMNLYLFCVLKWDKTS